MNGAEKGSPALGNSRLAPSPPPLPPPCALAGRLSRLLGAGGSWGRLGSPGPPAHDPQDLDVLIDSFLSLRPDCFCYHGDNNAHSLLSLPRLRGVLEEK